MNIKPETLLKIESFSLIFAVILFAVAFILLATFLMFKKQVKNEAGEKNGQKLYTFDYIRNNNIGYAALASGVIGVIMALVSFIAYRNK
jgi:purine-cytosine permease-like protein